jgi:hypothetical protein
MDKDKEIDRLRNIIQTLLRKIEELKDYIREDLKR